MALRELKLFGSTINPIVEGGLLSNGTYYPTNRYLYICESMLIQETLESGEFYIDGAGHNYLRKRVTSDEFYTLNGREDWDKNEYFIGFTSNTRRNRILYSNNPLININFIPEHIVKLLIDNPTGDILLEYEQGSTIISNVIVNGVKQSFYINKF